MDPPLLTKLIFSDCLGSDKGKPVSDSHPCRLGRTWPWDIISSPLLSLILHMFVPSNGHLSHQFVAFSPSFFTPLAGCRPEQRYPNVRRKSSFWPHAQSLCKLAGGSPLLGDGCCRAGRMVPRGVGWGQGPDRSNGGGGGTEEASSVPIRRRRMSGSGWRGGGA